VSRADGEFARTRHCFQGENVGNLYSSVRFPARTEFAGGCKRQDQPKLP
jgi:hypothetical protein